VGGGTQRGIKDSRVERACVYVCVCVCVCVSVCACERSFIDNSDKGDFMSRSRSLYCHSDTGPTGPTALILREKVRSSLSRPFKLFIRG
jgi:hypothetical protein